MYPSRCWEGNFLISVPPPGTFSFNVSTGDVFNPSCCAPSHNGCLLHWPSPPTQSQRTTPPRADLVWRFRGPGLGPGALTFGVSRADVGVVGRWAVAGVGMRATPLPRPPRGGGGWVGGGGRLAWQICHPGGRSVLTLPTRIKH